jgi:hypothetical protein
MKAFIEGFYLGSDSMRATLDTVLYPGMCDTVMVELHADTNPDNSVYRVTGTLDVHGDGNFSFPGSLAGKNYYLVIRHRNALETWSANAMTLVNNLSYDFTDAVTKAYGNNMNDLGDGKFGLWSGDVTQDGAIESADFSEMENALQQFIFYYHTDDLTGDNSVESADYSLLGNNLQLFIFIARP